jgi:hypothetical protein
MVQERQDSRQVFDAGWPRSRLFAQFLTLPVGSQGQMQIMRFGQAQHPLQQDLSWGGIQQVAAANDVSDLLFAVVHHYGQLVSEDAVRPAHDKIADIPSQLLREQAVQAVVEENCLVRDTGPPGPRAAAGRQPVPAVTRVHSGARLTPRTTAREYVATGPQPF